MEILLEKLNRVLLIKRFGDRENELIIQAFYILSNYYQNNREKLAEFIRNVEGFKQFRIVTDVNEEELKFKDVVKYIDKSEKEKIRMYRELYGVKVFFKKVDGCYIQDDNGEYVLTGLGYKSREGELFVFDTEQKLEIFIHEYEHTTQPGFKMTMGYIGSNEITSSSYFSGLFREGDATRLQLLSSLYENFPRLIDNKVSYFGEFHIFNFFLIMMGEDFIEKWKSDTSDEDYVKKMIDHFNNIGKGETLLKVQSLLYFLCNVKLISDDKLNQELHSYQESVEEEKIQFSYFAENMKSLNNSNVKRDRAEYLKRNYRISQHELYANQYSLLVIRDIMLRYKEYKYLTEQEKKCYLQNMKLEIEVLFEDSIQVYIEHELLNQEFFNGYYIFLLSSFKINDDNNELNEDNELITRKQELVDNLRTNRLKTLKTIVDRTDIDDIDFALKRIIELHKLNEQKLPLLPTLAILK